ncbi:exodeoxyribonuclease VII small subunit [Candidatus Saccharibacteria bacterium]|nr:exodeoxyribonuclease VII small subunit [Candidatus Saccharibacteria bacterium]
MAEKKTINQKIDELNNSVEWFYGDDFVLEKAPEKYQSAVKLAKDIQKDLDDLKNKIEVIDKDFSKA